MYLQSLVGGCVSDQSVAGAEESEEEKPGFFMSLFGTVAERGVRVCLLEL